MSADPRTVPPPPCDVFPCPHEGKLACAEADHLHHEVQAATRARAEKAERERDLEAGWRDHLMHDFALMCLNWTQSDGEGAEPVTRDQVVASLHSFMRAHPAPGHAGALISILGTWTTERAALIRRVELAEANLAAVNDHPPSFIITRNGTEYHYRLMAHGPVGTWTQPATGVPP